MSATTDPKHRPDRPPAPPVRRKWPFRMLAILLPFLVVGVVELVGRIAGYGGIPSVLVPMAGNKGRELITVHTGGIQSFFVALPEGAGRIHSTVFPRQKEPNTVRIFVVGGSAAQGYPEPRNLSLSSFLEAMLRDLWPDRRLEIINLSVVAVASFPVRCIYEEAIQYDPDLMIVYTGNNEFYGAQGVASVHSFGRTPQAMRIHRESRRWALLQMLDQVFRRSPAAASGKGMMELVMADQQIPPADPRRTAAPENLYTNITAMIASGASHGVPAIVCTLPVNDRDLFPLGEDPPPPLSESEQRRFSALLEQGRKLVADDPEAALTKLREAAVLEADHALLQYLLGRCLTALGAHDDALQAYIRAIDLDPMPWRAPSQSNEAVRKAAADGGAVLCDLAVALRSHSPGGATGWEMMDDHVHPSLEGQARIAQALLQSMTHLEGRVHVDPEAAGALPEWTHYAQELGATVYDDYSVVCSVLALYDLPFFRRSNAQAEQRFIARRTELEQKMSPPERQAAQEWNQGVLSRQGALPLVGVMGRVAFRAQDFAKADHLLALARAQLAPFSTGRLDYGSMALEARAQLRPAPSEEDVALAEELLETGKLMIQLSGDNAPLSVYRDTGLIALRLGRREEAIGYFEQAARRVQSVRDFIIVQILVNNLMETNDVTRARRILNELKSRPELAGACSQMLQGLPK
jgi:tetratricopeptide (TPR) repeat protein